MKTTTLLLFVTLMLGFNGCKKDAAVSQADQGVKEYMNGVTLEFQSVVDFTKSKKGRFNAATVNASKYTNSNGVEILLIEGLTAFSQSQGSISIYIPYTGLGNYSANDTDIRVSYRQGGFQYWSNYGGGGAFMQVLKDENGIVEGTFRYVAVSFQSNAVPYVVGHDDGVFLAKLD